MAAEAGYKPHEADMVTVAEIQIVIEADYNRLIQDLRNTRTIAHTIVCANWGGQGKPPSAEKFMPLPGDSKVKRKKASPSEILRQWDKRKKLAEAAKNAS